MVPQGEGLPESAALPRALSFNFDMPKRQLCPASARYRPIVMC
jgi:hypothetical protein